MSVGYNVYIGPYIKCKVSYKNILATKNCCTNMSCDQIGITSKNKYCPDCGELIGDLNQIESLPQVKKHDIYYEKCHEKIHPVSNQSNSPEYHTYLPNQDCFGQVRLDDMDYGFQEQPINPGDITIALLKFKEDYMDCIKVCEEAYGADGIAVEYGVIAYCS